MLHCNFCGKSEKEVKVMIHASKGDICDACVFLCVKVLIDRILGKEDRQVDFPKEKKEESGADGDR
jgi:ATP-dependent Clp protease ATP-binding subunit ClpX